MSHYERMSDLVRRTIRSAADVRIRERCCLSNLQPCIRVVVVANIYVLQATGTHRAHSAARGIE